MSSNPAQHVLQVATGYMASAALYVAVKLGVAEKLGDGPQDTTTLARLTNTHEDALYRILRLLMSVGIFEEVSYRRFALNDVAQALRKDVPGSMHGMAVFLPDPLHFRVYSNLMDSVRTGIPAAEGTLGMPVFDYLATDAEYSQIFNDAMSASGPVASVAIGEYDFSPYRTIIDVGGGQGEVLMSILRAYPNALGVLADLPHVVQGALPRIEAAGLAARCRILDCDFFEGIPAGGDLYVMKSVLHDWNDDQCTAILENLARSMGGRTGNLLLMEAVIPAGPGPDFGKFIDIEMLAMAGGRERSEEEFRSLLKRSGFELLRVVPTQTPLSILEAKLTG
jgi:hypothetical protein